MTVSIKINAVADQFILRWADFFSASTGTCLLHSCNHPSEKHPKSLLFLCPINIWSEKNLQIQASLEQIDSLIGETPLPIYGALSYEIGSPYRSTQTPYEIDPLYTLFQASLWVIWDNETGDLLINYSSEHLQELIFFFNEKKQVFERFLQGELPFRQPLMHSYCGSPLHIVEWESEKKFTTNVEKVKRLIYEGDIYQLNISYRITLHGAKNPFHLFDYLMKRNPSPQSAFLALSSSQVAISSSPERLLKREGKQLISQPIKGTRPRGRTAEEDRCFMEQLKTSAKERSELAMITDLVRNDLFSASRPGTIRVKEAFRIDSYESVLQQSSIIESEAKQTCASPLQTLSSLFPGGSITGCPKKRALLRIHQIEQRMRGIYTGSIGYWISPSCYDWNIAIRTILVDTEKRLITFSVGSGIVWDSHAYEEYEETHHKAKSLINACGIGSHDITAWRKKS